MRYFVSRINTNLDSVVVSVDEGVSRQKVRSLMENILVSVISNFLNKIVMQL